MNKPLLPTARHSSIKPLAVSVVIRVKDEAGSLETLLYALSSQEGVCLEVIVVDNESVDSSRCIAKRFGARVLTINRSEFSYGKALNMGFASAGNEFVCVLSAHSIPLGRFVLLEAALLLQSPHLAAINLLRVPMQQGRDRWGAIPSLRRSCTVQELMRFGLDNSGAMVRHSVWRRIGFEECVAAAEDKLWAWSVVSSTPLEIGNCGAPFAYVKDLSPIESVRKRHREAKVIFRTLDQLPILNTRRLVSVLLWHTPKRLCQVSVAECLWLLMMVSMRVRLLMAPTIGSTLRTSVASNNCVGGDSDVPGKNDGSAG